MTSRAARGLGTNLGIAGACALALLGTSLALPDTADWIAAAQYDGLFDHVRVEPPLDERLVLFDIDDPTLDALDQFPVARGTHAELVNGLATVGAKAVVWDYLFVGEREGDDALAAAFASVPTVLAVAAFRAESPTAHRESDVEAVRKFSVGPLLARWTSLAPVFLQRQSRAPFLQAAAAAGHVASFEDGDGIVRRVAPVVRVDDKLLAHLGFAAALQTLGVPPDDVELEGRTLVVGTRTLAEPVRVPLERDGTMLIDFPTDWLGGKNPLDRRRYAEQLGSLRDFPEEMAEDLAGRTVFVGYSGGASADFVSVPWSKRGMREPGVLVSIAVANAVLTRTFLQSAPAAAGYVLLVLCPLLAALAWWRARPLGAALATAGLLLALPLLSVVLFRFGATFLPVAGPFVATALAGALLGTITLVRERAHATRITAALARFVSPALLRELEEAAAKDELPPARRAELSVLFIDVAGFTPFTEGQEPEVLSAFLDRFYEMAMEELFRQGGMLEKFMGDGVLAYFGAPEPLPDKERRAVAAAMAIRDRFAALDAERVAAGGPPLAIRCGIATGWVAVGYFGGRTRGTYGVIGRSVNLAARIQGFAEPGGILVDRATAARLEGTVPTRPLEPIQLKGIAKPVEVFAVGPAGGAEALGHAR